MGQRINREDATYEGCKSFLADEPGPIQVGAIDDRPMHLGSSKTNPDLFRCFL